VAIASQSNAAIITFFQALHIEASQSDSDPMNRNFFLNLAFFKRSSSCLENTMSTSYCYDHISLNELLCNEYVFIGRNYFISYILAYTQ
jgi:hypothetical protein